jgi:hypothetical protein
MLSDSKLKHDKSIIFGQWSGTSTFMSLKSDQKNIKKVPHISEYANLRKRSKFENQNIRNERYNLEKEFPLVVQQHKGATNEFWISLKGFNKTKG